MHANLISNLLAVCAFILSITTRISATETVNGFRYTARLSAQDHIRYRDNVNLVNIPGIKPQDILLQDRLNFHKFGKRDIEDSDDGVFSIVGEILYQKYLEIL